MSNNSGLCISQTAVKFKMRFRKFGSIMDEEARKLSENRGEIWKALTNRSRKMVTIPSDLIINWVIKKAARAGSYWTISRRRRQIFKKTHPFHSTFPEIFWPIVEVPCASLHSIVEGLEVLLHVFGRLSNESKDVFGQLLMGLKFLAHWLLKESNIFPDSPPHPLRKPLIPLVDGLHQMNNNKYWGVRTLFHERWRMSSSYRLQ